MLQQYLVQVRYISWHQYPGISYAKFHSSVSFQLLPIAHDLIDHIAATTCFLGLYWAAGPCILLYPQSNSQRTMTSDLKVPTHILAVVIMTWSVDILSFHFLSFWSFGNNQFVICIKHYLMGSASVLREKVVERPYNTQIHSVFIPS